MITKRRIKKLLVEAELIINKNTTEIGIGVIPEIYNKNVPHIKTSIMRLFVGKLYKLIKEDSILLRGTEDRVWDSYLSEVGQFEEEKK